MLSPEVASEQLKGFYSDDWADACVSQARRLHGNLGRIACAILRCDGEGRPLLDWQAQQESSQWAAPQVGALSTREREQLLDALFPRLAPHVERAWELYRRLPYQVGTERKAFRAPNSLSVYGWRRFLWLQDLARATAGYPQDVAWFAAWAPYLGGWGAADAFGVLLAAAIDAGEEEGDAVLDVLIATTHGEHPIGAMGRHVTRGLLVASRPEGWRAVESLLLAAQRQEGLRQVILETVDEAHPEAFCRMLRLILDHSLTRFSAVVRAVDVWFGLGWDANQARAVDEVLQQVLCYLDDSSARMLALEGDQPQALYLALWTLAFEDAVAAVAPGAQLLDDTNVERRFVATHLLGYLRLNTSQHALLPALDDPDLRVAACALEALGRYPNESLKGSDLFERVERLLPRLPSKERSLEPIVWPWLTLRVGRQRATGTLIWSLGERSPRRLIPHLPMMTADDRGRVVQQLAAMSTRDAQVRDTLLTLVGDRSRWVRGRALEALAEHTVTPEEAIQLEGLLARKVADLRRGVLSMLLNQADRDAVASAERLLQASDLQQRLAGLELLRQMVEEKRAAKRCRALAVDYRSQRDQLLAIEERTLSLLLEDRLEVATLDDALGLMDPDRRTPPTGPKGRKVPRLRRREWPATRSAKACVRALDELVHRQRTTPVWIVSWDGSRREELLGNVRWGFPVPQQGVSPQEDLTRLPLGEMWETWWAQRPDDLRDDDGLELIRALAALFGAPSLPVRAAGWRRAALSRLFGADDEPLHYPTVICAVLQWLVCLHPPSGSVDLILGGVEATLAAVPHAELKRIPDVRYELDWRHDRTLLGWLALARWHRAYQPQAWQDEDHIRLWGLVRWIDEPGPPVPRHRPTLEDALLAHRAGGATEADLLDYLLGPRSDDRYGFQSFSELGLLSGRKPHPLLETYPVLRTLIERCRERILEVELARGEMPTAASRPALSLRHAGGAHTLVKLLQRLARGKLVRGWTYDSLSKAAVLSHLIRSTWPLETDTPEWFTANVAQAGISEGRLVEVAVYAPQWAGYVEGALGWPGLAEAVWWIHAHTKDANWRVDQEIRQMWNAQISEYTPLSGEALLDGAVDVRWFHQAYQLLGAERWDRVSRCAKYASGGGGHARARLFADAMLGQVQKEELLSRIEDKRHQDTVRALGLLPLADGVDRGRDLLERYRVLQRFLRTSRRFGSQRQASERVAVKVGMENLARTAGYPDPVRLEWAMEAEETADLAEGGQVIQAGETVITLSIDSLGEPGLTVEKGGRRLRRIPAALRKQPHVAALCERRKQLKQQASRMRRSLEHAMCRGDRFSGAELRELMAHPLLAPMLGQLILLGDRIVGYPVEAGTALEYHDGSRVVVSPEEVLRIAHPHDLYTAQEWHHWQRDCYLSERAQPFKQVFRELYLLTAGEKAEGTISRRYAGHQVNPRQALALLGQRGWVNYPGEGVRRTFHEEGLSAWLSFLQGFYTPAEVEGLTLEGVSFTRRGDWRALNLEDVPPRLFSEVMWDLDLVVSVAHQGGVDPEASASTVDMRAALIRETCAMLEIPNVKVEGRYALVEGKLASYNVHLGSAVVHQQPGGTVCIVPVHAQHRGRLFLPFVDDDPKTAEVISKVLLLARDSEIKDPTILEQIHHRPV